MSIRILLVDDYEMFRVQLRRTLGQLGISEVDEATDGAEALKLLNGAYKEGKPYSMMLLDVNMPRMNGFEVLESCRGDERFKKLPIVIISAESEKDYHDHAMKVGATDYIVKPIESEQLKAKLKHISQFLTETKSTAKA